MSLLMPQSDAAVLARRADKKLLFVTNQLPSPRCELRFERVNIGNRFRLGAAVIDQHHFEQLLEPAAEILDELLLELPA